ncbi:hypothetical protein RN001_007548 [Aquatica leii]|uniref:DUF4806 domain-containing protein n=1 Tax=Aquatica leii TaxID=1421715 RepID=A0AAN7P8G7_9COLE|nr:hypothetical protein RN001_007548 [Aquatica leii]
MKTLVVLNIFISVALSKVSFDLIDDWNNVSAPYADECILESGANPEMARKMFENHKLVDEEHIRCYFKCLSLKGKEIGMAFAVVYFHEDKTYSEIPTNWLSEDRTSCWWPKSKNPNLLMTKSVVPNESWDQFEVSVQCYTNTLGSARKKAEDSDYSTSSMEDRGRGKRKKNKINSQSSESDESRTATPPPIITKFAKQRKNKENLSITSNIHEASVIIYEEDLNLSDVKYLQESTVVPLSIVTDENLPSTQTANTSRNVTPTYSINSASRTMTPQSSCLTNSVEDKLNTLINTCAAINQYVKSIDNRLKLLENDAQKPVEISPIFVEKLPIQTLEDLKEFESLLTSNENKIQLANFIKTIGGRHPKDCVHRILKRIYSNRLGVHCSWLGQRNNFRVCDLRNMIIIKETMIAAYHFKENDFESYASEWFRLSKLRLTREQQKHSI